MKKVMSFILAIICVFGIVPVYTMAEDPQATNPDYAYFMNTTEDSAYSMLGETIENKGMEFFDGIGMGITEKSNAFYNELILLDGLYARKQYSSNNAFFKINKDFYETGDTEFLISIVFYDFGPSEGKFYFEYFCENGATKQVTLVKPGTNPGWAVKTVCLDDMDLTKEYENGANFRIINGAYNAFKKVEVINLSKAKREKKNVPVTGLGVELRTEMESLRLIDINDERFI
ncbi:MAG: hypothetical protein U0M60_15965, partial [Clostridia bacterium]|nr:hypothetical protein [Clostridia bacterium]